MNRSVTLDHTDKVIESAIKKARFLITFSLWEDTYVSLGVIDKESCLSS